VEGSNEVERNRRKTKKFSEELARFLLLFFVFWLPEIIARYAVGTSLAGWKKKESSSFPHSRDKLVCWGGGGSQFNSGREIMYLFVGSIGARKYRLYTPRALLYGKCCFFFKLSL